MHNNFLNYYGKIIDTDLAIIKDELQIDELIDDWLYKKLMKRKSVYISEDYFNRKIYSIPSIQ